MASYSPLLKLARVIGHLPHFPGQQRVINRIIPWKRTRAHYEGIARLGQIRLHVDTRSMIERDVYVYGSYEADSLLAIGRLQERGIIGRELFLDIGANVGIYSLALSKAFDEVVSFEPSPITYDRLLRNIALNDASNVTPQRVAVGAAEGNLDFCYPTDANENHGVAGFAENHLIAERIAYRKAVVAVVTIDSVIGDRKVSFVKIDIEGYELYALQGMEKTLRQSRPVVLLELGEEEQTRLGGHGENVVKWLRDREYAILMHGKNSFAVPVEHGVTRI